VSKVKQPIRHTIGHFRLILLDRYNNWCIPWKGRSSWTGGREIPNAAQ